MDIVTISIVLCLVGAIALGIYHGLKEAEKKEAAKTLYHQSLDYLGQRPSDPTARIRCLELGRIYYAYEIPDTQTYQNGQIVDKTDNSANREARIKNDIEARVCYLKARGCD